MLQTIGRVFAMPSVTPSSLIRSTDGRHVPSPLASSWPCGGPMCFSLLRSIHGFPRLQLSMLALRRFEARIVDG